MRKINKNTLDSHRKGCVDYIHKGNTTNLRWRYVFFIYGKFVCIEGNSNGVFIDESITEFSNSVSWVNGV